MNSIDLLFMCYSSGNFFFRSHKGTICSSLFHIGHRTKYSFSRAEKYRLDIVEKDMVQVTENDWFIVPYSLYTITEGLGLSMWTSGDLDCTSFCVYIAAYSQQCRAEKGDWFSSITPLIMRQHGSGCAAMATVFH